MPNFGATELSKELIRMVAQDCNVMKRNSMYCLQLLNFYHDYYTEIHRLIQHTDVAPDDWESFTKWISGVDSLEEYELSDRHTITYYS